MATLAALLKSRGHDVQGSDQNVYPPMSDFLVAKASRVQRLSRRTHHAGYRPGGGRQRDLARKRRARSGARAQDPLLLAARSDSRSLPVGRPVDRHRRHARQDDDDVADGLAADPRRRRSDGARWRHRAELRRARIELSRRAGAGLRDRGRRIRQRVLRQDGEVPQVPARYRGHQEHRVRSRRYLRRPRRGHGWRSAGWSTWCRATGCRCLAPTARTRAALGRLAVSRVADIRSRPRRRLAAHDMQPPATADAIRACAATDAVRPIRVAAARRAQRPERARRHRRWRASVGVDLGALPKGCRRSRA